MHMRAVLLCTLIRIGVPVYITTAFNFMDSRTITNLINAFNWEKTVNRDSNFIFDH